jgi:hypothetical protein
MCKPGLPKRQPLHHRRQTHLKPVPAIGNGTIDGQKVHAKALVVKGYVRVTIRLSLAQTVLFSVPWQDVSNHHQVES